jgi:hypothetical protein
MVREIRLVAEASIQKKNLASACLYWADETVKYLTRQGIRAIIQAGTASWPMIDPEQDDGVSPTNFSYIFEGVSAQEAEGLLRGRLPEMHVWAAIPDRNEIIDLTTRYWPEQALVNGGYEWAGQQPPDYLWEGADRLPDRVIYHPHPQATKLALDLLAKDEQPLMVVITK